MSIRAVAWALGQYGLTPVQKLALVHLADAAVSQGISDKQIANVVGTSLDATKEALLTLEARGLALHVPDSDNWLPNAEGQHL
jgi:hypothetical protein